MHDIVEVRRKPSRRRGLHGQRRRRHCERKARRAAVAFARCCRLDGVASRGVAAMLGIDERTLCRWVREWHRDRLALEPRGRPPTSVDADTRRDLIAMLASQPTLGAPTLCKRCPELGRREATELGARWRGATRRDRRQLIFSLRWTRAGSVWAADFSDPPLPVNGIYDKILCNRDLPSHAELWAQPTIGKHTRTLIDALEAHVRWHGAPLVQKVDNDGVFRSGALRDWTERHGILLLFSPPVLPEYNGAVEAGMHGLKLATHIVSASHDRPGEWIADDLQEALALMNEQARPRGFRGPSAQELWDARTPITDAERQAFHAVYREQLRRAYDRRGLDPALHLQHPTRSAVERDAIRRSLIKTGYLELRRRRISLKVSRWKCDRITS